MPTKPKPSDEVTRDRYAHLAPPASSDLLVMQRVDSHLRKLGPSWRIRPLADERDGYGLERRHKVPVDPEKPTGDKRFEWRVEETYATLRDLATAKGLL